VISLDCSTWRIDNQSKVGLGENPLKKEEDTMAKKKEKKEKKGKKEQAKKKAKKTKKTKKGKKKK